MNSMKIFVKVKANSKTEKIEKMDGKNFIVSVKTPAKEGKANSAVVKALAEYFGVAKSDVVIISGLSSKQKIIEVAI